MGVDRDIQRPARPEGAVQRLAPSRASDVDDSPRSRRPRAGRLAGGRTRSVDEAIAEADHRLNPAAGVSELRAEMSDMDVDRAGLDRPVVAPHAFEQPVARQDLIAVFYQVHEQFELAPREADG